MTKGCANSEESREAHPPKALMQIAAGILVVALAGLASCSGQTGPTPTAGTAPTASSTSGPPATEPAPSVSPTPVHSHISLRVWVPPQFTIAAGSPLFTDVISEFEAAYPGIQVDLSVKAVTGKGGLLDLLEGAGLVAPSYLPDLILMDDASTTLAAERDLLQALDEVVTASANDRAFAGIFDIGMRNETRYAMPFAMDFLHLAYRMPLTVTMPLNWSSVLESGGRYLIASGGSENYNSDSILIQYLGLDGKLADSEGKATVDSRLLTRVLDAYKQMADQEALALGSLQLDSPDEIWSRYKMGEAEFAEVWASQFKAEAESLPDTAFARIPTRNGRAAALAHVWAWSIAARAVERKQAAASFLEWVLDPSRQRAWCEAARLLPTGAHAWPLPGLPAEYSGFLQGLAEIASPLPAPLRSPEVSTALQQALSRVVLEGILPKQAAEEAIANMKLP